MSLDYTVHVGPFVTVDPQEGAPSWGDVSDLLKEAMYHYEDEDGKHLWFPNVDRKPPRQMSFDPKRETVTWLIDSMDILNEQSIWFVKAFAPEIAILREVYGKQNVRIVWGVVSMIS